MRVTLETDMYAFACVLYEIYTGGIPYYGENIIDCLRERRRPSLHRLGEPIVRLIEGCWHHDPRLRPKASVVVEALKKMKKFQLISLIGLWTLVVGIR